MTPAAKRKAAVDQIEKQAKAAAEQAYTAMAEASTRTLPSILEEAHTIIYGDREKTYGSPAKNLQTIADLWSVQLTAKYNISVDLTTDDVCAMMISLKLARLTNNPTHRDSIVDIAGYAALAAITNGTDHTNS